MINTSYNSEKTEIKLSLKVLHIIKCTERNKCDAKFIHRFFAYGCDQYCAKKKKTCHTFDNLKKNTEEITYSRWDTRDCRKDLSSFSAESGNKVTPNDWNRKKSVIFEWNRHRYFIVTDFYSDRTGRKPREHKYIAKVFSGAYPEWYS